MMMTFIVGSLRAVKFCLQTRSKEPLGLINCYPKGRRRGKLRKLGLGAGRELAKKKAKTVQQYPKIVPREWWAPLLR